MAPTCHPSRPHYAKGLCQVCWRAAYQRTRYAAETERERKRRRARTRKNVAAFRARKLKANRA